MLAQYVFLKYLAVIEGCLFPIMLGSLNTRSRYRAMAEESIPLSSFSLGASEASSSQPVDRELQSVRI